MRCLQHQPLNVYELIAVSDCVGAHAAKQGVGRPAGEVRKSYAVCACANTQITEPGRSNEYPCVACITCQQRDIYEPGDDLLLRHSRVGQYRAACPPCKQVIWQPWLSTPAVFPLEASFLSLVGPQDISRSFTDNSPGGVDSPRSCPSPRPKSPTRPKGGIETIEPRE